MTIFFASNYFFLNHCCGTTQVLKEEMNRKSLFNCPLNKWSPSKSSNYFFLNHCCGTTSGIERREQQEEQEEFIQLST